jgi:acyl-CoA thioester hydrolase
MQSDLNKYKHKYQVRVRNFEVDSLGVLHNAIYLEYCETGRVEYFRQLGFKLLPGGFFDEGINIMVKRNEITYESPARIDDLVDIYTRITYIKNSSFCFEHVLINPESNKFLCYNKSILVNINHETNLPEHLPEKYRELIEKFEDKDLEIIK